MYICNIQVSPFPTVPRDLSVAKVSETTHHNATHNQANLL